MIDQFKKNWKSGLSVALISVPLSLSLGIAAGATPVAGIITAIWAGLVAGLVGGSQYNIVGPAGALSGILVAYSLQYTPAILPFVAIGAGILTLIVWLLRWDRYLIFIPSSVVHGFTLGVAFTIGFGQLNSALGLSGLPAHETLLENIIESFRHIGSLQLTAFIPFLIGLAILFYILKKRPLWPNSIIVAILGMLFGYASKIALIPLSIVTLGDKYPGLTLRLFSLPDTASLFSVPALANMSTLAVVTLIFKLSSVVAFVLVLETLISAKIADGLTKTKFRQSREVLGVGLANLAAGLFGGVPASGVFARTAMNVRSGASSSASQVINAVFVALITFVLLPVFGYVPMSIIAAILVYVASRMIVVGHFRKLYFYDKIAFSTAMAVGILTVAYDATTGILVGTAAALLFLVNKMSVAQCNVTAGMKEPLTENADVVVYRFAGELTYVNSKSHIEQLEKVAVGKALVLNFRSLFYIDLDGIEALHEIVDRLESKGHQLYVTGVHGEVETLLASEKWFGHLRSHGHVLSSTQEALFLAKAA